MNEHGELMKISLMMVAALILGSAQTSMALKPQQHTEEKRFFPASKIAKKGQKETGRNRGVALTHREFIAAASLVGLATAAWFSAVYFSLEDDDSARLDELYHRMLDALADPEAFPLTKDEFYAIVLPALGLATGVAAGAAGVAIGAADASSGRQWILLLMLTTTFLKVLQ